MVKKLYERAYHCIHDLKYERLSPISVFHVYNLRKSLGYKKHRYHYYLPPYSPDLNPIEHYWHKIKTTIRKMMRDTKMLLDEAM